MVVGGIWEVEPTPAHTMYTQTSMQIQGLINFGLQTLIWIILFQRAVCVLFVFSVRWSIAL